MDLIDTYRTSHPKASEYTFFSSARGIFSRTVHFLGHKRNFNKFKRIEIISFVTIKVRNEKSVTEIKTNTCRLNSVLIKKPWVSVELKKEIRKYLKTNANKNITIQKPVGYSKSNSWQFVVIQAYLEKKEQKILKQPTF